MRTYHMFEAAIHQIMEGLRQNDGQCQIPTAVGEEARAIGQV